MIVAVIGRTRLDGKRPHAVDQVVDSPDAHRSSRTGVILYAAAVALLAAIALPLWKPLVLAGTLAAPLASLHERAARALGNRRTLSAALFTAGATLIIVLPIAAAALLLTDQAIHLVDVVRGILKQRGVSGLLEPLPDSLAKWLQHVHDQVAAGPAEILSHARVQSHSGWALSTLAGVLSAVSHLLFAFLMMVVALFFLLRDGRALKSWFKEKSPIGAQTVDRLVGELSDVSKSVIGGNIGTGAAQSVVATIGFLIAGAPAPFLLGLLTFVASFIPSVGTALVAVPIVGLLVLLGRGWWAVFLAGWMVVIVGLIDNLVRPLLMRGRSNLQGSLVFFSLMGGVLAFGAMGLVVGPLALAFFLAMSATIRPPPSTT